MGPPDALKLERPLVDYLKLPCPMPTGAEVQRSGNNEKLKFS